MSLQNSLRTSALALLILLPAGHSAGGQGAAGQSPSDQPMRILVTNDDGWQSDGLKTLVAELAVLGEVVVAAPSGNRSGSSQSIQLAETVAVEAIEIDGASAAWSIDATPAAACDLGLGGLAGDEPFDLVVSGINRGSNVGNISHLSGTVGAAMQAALHGVPAIAVSQDTRAHDFTVAARYTVDLIRALQEQGHDPGIVYSVNVPAAATQGPAEAVVRPMGGSYLELGKWKQTDDGSWRPLIIPRASGIGLAGSDTEAYLEGKITVTPLAFDWTVREVQEATAAWLPQPRVP